MNQPNKQFHRGFSISILLMFGFGLTAVVPVSLLGIKVYDAAWENAWREVREKHQLLAENLSAPLTIYVSKHESILHIAGDLIRQELATNNANPDSILPILQASIRRSNGLKAIYLFDPNKNLLRNVSLHDQADGIAVSRVGSMKFLSPTFSQGEKIVSTVLIHPMTNEPSLFLSVGVNAPSNSGKFYVLVGELNIEPIETLRRGISFGQGGHSAIVDSLGTVIAHPNPAWMKEGKDLSHISIVQNMMAGKTGVTEFYSPFKKYDMVAGFTAVPDLGWGIMVPQPKPEIVSQINSILFAELGWAVGGIILALILAHYLSRWITQPLYILAQSGQKLSQQGFQHNLPTIRDSAPTEVRKLAGAFNDAIHGLSISRAEVDELNKSLQRRVKEATNELRQANTKLGVLARSDHLTKLANRRHFEQTISNMTKRREEDNRSVCMLLIDIDRFKEINDSYGHAAGDMVLVQIAEVLDRNMRQTDLSARYAGDEFVAMIHADINVGRVRAESLRNEIALQQFIFNHKSFHVTVSVGITEWSPTDQSQSVDDILLKVDEAMYQAKRAGRDKVAEFKK